MIRLSDIFNDENRIKELIKKIPELEINEEKYSYPRKYYFCSEKIHEICNGYEICNLASVHLKFYYLDKETNIKVYNKTSDINIGEGTVDDIELKISLDKLCEELKIVKYNEYLINQIVIDIGTRKKKIAPFKDYMNKLNVPYTLYDDSLVLKSSIINLNQLNTISSLLEKKNFRIEYYDECQEIVLTWSEILFPENKM